MFFFVIVQINMTFTLFMKKTISPKKGLFESSFENRFFRSISAFHDGVPGSPGRRVNGCKWAGGGVAALRRGGGGPVFGGPCLCSLRVVSFLFVCLWRPLSVFFACAFFLVCFALLCLALPALLCFACLLLLAVTFWRLLMLAFLAFFPLPERLWTRRPPSDLGTLAQFEGRSKKGNVKNCRNPPPNKDVFHQNLLRAEF